MPTDPLDDQAAAHEHDHHDHDGGDDHGADHHDHADHADHHGEHAPGWWGAVRHALSELAGTHSHDSADQVDDALEADRRGRRALWISLVGLGITAALQAVVVVVSGSVALLGDTVHNLADALTAVPLFIAFALARRAPSRRYTYGYGRAEDLAGVVVVLAITASAVFAAWVAVDRLLHPRPVTHLAAVAAAGLVGFAGNEWVARYRIRVGRSIGSAALVADGLHARTDGFTSLAVLLGAGGVALGWQWADPAVGLLITVAILGVLRSAAREVLARLMDAVEPDLVRRAETALAGAPGVLAVRRVQLRWIGHTLHAEADLDVDAHLSLTDAHAVAHDAQDQLRHEVRRVGAATIHTSPAGGHAPV